MRTFAVMAGLLVLVGSVHAQESWKEDPPSYTAVCQDAEGLGAEAGSLLTRMLDGTIEQPVRVVLPTMFEVHQSTGPVPDK